MKPLLPVLAVLLLVTAAEARRARRTPVNTPTGVMVEEAELQACGAGFAVCRNTEGKGEIVGYDAEGRNPKTLVSTTARIAAWSPSPKDDVLAWVSAGKLSLRTPADEKPREVGDADAVRPAFSRDGKVVAFLSKGTLVLRDVEGERRREVKPRQGRRIEQLVFSGNWLMAVTAPVIVDDESFADTLERVDVTIQDLAFVVVHAAKDARLRSVCFSPVDDLAAFVEWKGDGEKSVLRVMTLGGGAFHDLTDTGEFRDLAFSADGRWLLENLGGVIHMQQLFRSGTAQTFYREILTVGDGKSDCVPVAGKGGMWFLRGTAGNALEVVKSELK